MNEVLTPRRAEQLYESRYFRSSGSCAAIDDADALCGQKPRAREKLAEEGPRALADAELIMAILGKGSRGKDVRTLSGEALEILDSLTGRGRAEAGREDAGGLMAAALSSISGMGPARSAALSAALELGRRLFDTRNRRISAPADVWALVSHYADRSQERFIVCSLNGAHELIAARVVSIGLVNRAIIHPREVFADPLIDRACAIVVAHNHPSGKLEPSYEDIEITERLRSAGEILGIDLLDHLIFSVDGYYSMTEAGFIAPQQG